MKKSKRILSFMMAVVIMMSSLSIVAQGRSTYVDTYLTNYDDLDKPVVTFNQACTMVLDSVDIVLAEGNQVIDLSILGSLRLTSINNALDDITGLVNGVAFTLLGWLVGDLNDLNVDAIDSSNGTPRRTTGQDTKDTDVIYALVRFLNDNKNIVGKLIDGSIDLGVASSAFDPADLNINQMVKGIIYGLAYPDAIVPENITENADTMVQKIITDLFQGKLDPKTGEYDGLAPELVPYIDIVNTTSPAYDFIGTLLQQAWNLMIVPLLNTDVKKMVREACGVVYNPLNPNDPGNASNLNEYAAIFNIDFIIPSFTVPTGSTFIAQLNNILAGVVNELAVSYTWENGANSNLLANMSAVAKYILNETGSALFPDYIDTYSADEVNAMTDQQLFSYLLRSLLNTLSDSLYIPADADSLVEVLWYGIKEALVKPLPAIDYAAQPKTQAGVLYMLGDLIAYTLNQTADMNTATGTTPGTGLVAYGQGLNATLLAATNWARTNYGGLFSSSFSTTDPWAAIDTLAFTILLQANWLPASVNGSSYELLINRLFGGFLNLDVTNVLALFERRADSELAIKTIKQILIDTVTRVINNIFPAAVGGFTTFDAIISNANLAVIVKNIASQLYTRRTSIMPVIMPLLAGTMNRSSPQAYQDPDIQLPDVVGAATTFAIRNDSTGINTGSTDKNGNFIRDNLYKISIVSVVSSIPAITVSNLAGTVINGGDAVNCSLGGTFTANQQLMVTVTYNVLTEAGAVLTPVALSQRAYAYISTVVDDGTIWTTVDSGDNNYHKMKYLNSYFKYPAAPEEPVLPVAPTPEETAAYEAAHAQWLLAMAQYTVSKNASMQELKNPVAQIIRDPKTTLSHNTNATVSRGTATVNATLAANGISAAPFTNIATTGDGGTWNPKYFTVSTSPTRPADGVYASSYVFTATKTKSLGGNSESYTIPYKVVLYTDYDLPGILEGAINANRDPNNYSDQTAYSNYITAIKNAVAVCFRPRQAATFMTTHAPFYAPYATALKDAIETLEESAIFAGVDPLKTAMDTVTPPNEDLEYDDPAYNYFGLEDYVPYTYINYSEKKDSAYSMWASQQLPEEPEAPAVGATQAEINAYNTAYALWETAYATALKAIVPVDAVSVAYVLHRFNLYAGRLVRVQAVKARLNEALTLVNANMPLEYGCSSAKWSTFSRAYNFAVAVNAQSATATDSTGAYILRQTKVNEARDRLIEAWKTTTQVFVEALPEAGVVIDNIGGYITGLDQGVSLATLLQTTPGSSLIFHDAPVLPGTGTVVDLMIGNDIVATFTVIIRGDLSRDGLSRSVDALMALQTSADVIALGGDQTLAGDVNGSGTVTSFDALKILQYSAGIISSF